tara:strand:+ start:36 stop:428 length:393 start_codon:yes stop_codon:yes gene_type:complete
MNVTNKNKNINVCAISFFKIFLCIYFISYSVSTKSINPLSMDTDSINNGAELYKKRCSNCHGINAEGKNNGFFLSPNLKKFQKGYTRFLNILVNGYGRMPAWGGKSELTDDQLNQLAAYLEHISYEKKNW